MKEKERKLINDENVVVVGCTEYHSIHWTRTTHFISSKNQSRFHSKYLTHKISNQFHSICLQSIRFKILSENNSQNLGLTELPRKFQLDSSSVQSTMTKSTVIVECNSVSVILCGGGVTIRDELKRSFLDALCVVRNLIKLPVNFRTSL